MLTPKKRWLAVLQRKMPDCVPMDYWGADDTTARLMRHLDGANPWAVAVRLQIDCVFGVKPAYAGPPL